MKREIANEHWVSKGGHLLIKRMAPVGAPCAICGKPMPKPCFDHDHDTAKFRGWLCPTCNTGLGFLGDNVEGLMRAVRYLETTN